MECAGFLLHQNITRSRPVLRPAPEELPQDDVFITHPQRPTTRGFRGLAFQRARNSGFHERHSLQNPASICIGVICLRKNHLHNYLLRRSRAGSRIPETRSAVSTSTASCPTCHYRAVLDAAAPVFAVARVEVALRRRRAPCGARLLLGAKSRSGG